MLFEILLAFVSMGILLAIGDFLMNLLPVCAIARLERLFGLTKTEKTVIWQRTQLYTSTTK